MNHSGVALASLRADPAFNAAQDLLILVDDFAIPTGTFRLRTEGSAGGHNGLKSVEGALQSQQYARLRIGVGPLPPGIEGWRDFVLEVPPKDERERIRDLLPTMAEAVETWMVEGIERAMAKHNRKPKRTEPED
jgi:PTH1 family peptidyl-tRNA hydrolase